MAAKAVIGLRRKMMEDEAGANEQCLFAFSLFMGNEHGEVDLCRLSQEVIVLH